MKQLLPPERLPRNRFLRFIVIFISRYFSDDIARTGAELAYFLLFSLFPLLLLGSCIVGYLDLNLAAFLNRISPLIPTDILGMIGSYLTYLSTINTSGFLLTGAFFTLYSMTRVINLLLFSIGQIYRVRRPRHWLRQFLIAAILSVMLLVSILLILALIFFGEGTLSWLFSLLHWETWFLRIWDILRFVLLAVWAMLLLTTLYIVAPNRRIRLRDALPGAVFASIAWVAVSWVFSFYVNTFANYSLLYGSLGAIIVLMLWLYLTGVILLLGGLFNHLLEVFKHGDYTNEEKRFIQTDSVSVRRQKTSDGK